MKLFKIKNKSKIQYHKIRVYRKNIKIINLTIIKVKIYIKYKMKKIIKVIINLKKAMKVCIQ